MPSIPDDCGMSRPDFAEWDITTWCDTCLVWRELRCVDDPQGSVMASPGSTQGSYKGCLARMADRVRSAQMVLSIEWQSAGEDIRRSIVFCVPVSGSAGKFWNRYRYRTDVDTVRKTWTVELSVVAHQRDRGILADGTAPRRGTDEQASSDLSDSGVQRPIMARSGGACPDGLEPAPRTGDDGCITPGSPCCRYVCLRGRTIRNAARRPYPGEDL